MAASSTWLLCCVALSCVAAAAAQSPCTPRTVLNQAMPEDTVIGSRFGRVVANPEACLGLCLVTKGCRTASYWTRDNVPNPDKCFLYAAPNTDRITPGATALRRPSQILYCLEDTATTPVSTPAPAVPAPAPAVPAPAPAVPAPAPAVPAPAPAVPAPSPAVPAPAPAVPAPAPAVPAPAPAVPAPAPAVPAPAPVVPAPSAPAPAKPTPGSTLPKTPEAFAAQFASCIAPGIGAVPGQASLAQGVSANKLPLVTCFAYCKFGLPGAIAQGDCKSYVYDSATDRCTFYDNAVVAVTKALRTEPAIRATVYDRLCMDKIYRAPRSTSCEYTGYDVPFQKLTTTKKDTVANCKAACALDRNCDTFSYAAGSCAFQSARITDVLLVPNAGSTVYAVTCAEQAPAVPAPQKEDPTLPAASAYPTSPLAADLPAVSWGPYDYAKVLGMNFEFYELMWAGPLPSDYRVDWRAPGYVGACDGHDGGSFEAGNHIQSMLASGQAVQYQATSILYNRGVYTKSMYDGKTNLHWATRELRRSATWLANAFENPESVLIAIGDSSSFQFFGRAENAPEPTCQFATPDKPASDHVAQGATALALASIVFKAEDPVFSARLLDISKQYFNISKRSLDTARASGFNIGKLYPSYERRQPAKHQFVAACSLYQATGDITYYRQAKTYQDLARNRQGWPVLNWDNPYWSGLLCIARSAPSAGERADARDAIYKRLLQDWFQSKTPVGDGKRPLINRTPGGFPYWQTDREQNFGWGLLRDTSNIAYMALMYADLPGVPANLVKESRCFAKGVVQYILGNNKLNKSYVAGYTSTVATSFPLQVHNRDAACRKGSKTCNEISFRFSKRNNIYEVTGGLVAGPTFDDDFPDIRDEYVHTEIALDVNAALLALVAATANLPASFWATTC